MGFFFAKKNFFNKVLKKTQKKIKKGNILSEGRNLYDCSSSKG